MSDDKPYVRFNPSAYERVFRQSEIPCALCGRRCVREYAGSLYMAEEIAPICARCIFQGSLSRIAGNIDYSFHDIALDGASPELEDEVVRRTPGVACFNPHEWPVIDREPLCFVGYGGDVQV